MVSKTELQLTLFDKIRVVLPAHVSLVDEVSGILGISNDSAYRRIRNEKQLHVEEFFLLCRHFRISADELLGIDTSQVYFDYYRLNEKSFSFENYLEAIYVDLKNLCNQGNPYVYLIFNELNIFQILLLPLLAGFKFFFWSKSNLGFSDYTESLFSADHVSSRIRKLCNDIEQLYIQVPTAEFISTEALSSMLKQLCFYYEAGFFKSKNDVRMLCDELSELLRHLKKQAELGFKFAYGCEPIGIEGSYKLYLNDLVIVDNTVIAISDKSVSSYITNNVINLLVSHNKDFCEQNLNWANILVGNSTLISGAAERDRNRYFKQMDDQIQQLKEKICAE